MVNLKELHLYWNNWQDEITNLSFLLNFPNLEILRLRDGKITDIEPIKELKKLKEFAMMFQKEQKKILKFILVFILLEIFWIILLFLIV